MADLLNAWVDHQRDREVGGAIAPLSLVNYENRVARLLGTGAGSILAAHLTRADAEDVYTSLRKTDSASTARTDLHTLRSIVRWGAKRGFCADVDMTGIAAKPKERDRKYNRRIPTKEEAAKVIAAVEDGRYRDLLTLQAGIGCRIGEAIAIRNRDVDPSGWLTVSGEDLERERVGKTGRRRVPLMGDAFAVVLRRYDADKPDAYIFPLPASAGVNALKVLAETCDAVEVPRFTTHGLRYMAANAMLDAGSDPKVVSSITGHSVEMLLHTYRRPTDEQLRRALVGSGLGRLSNAGEVVSLEARRAQIRGTTSYDDVE